MSATHEGGNGQPVIDKEEHRSVNGVNAKAVVPYLFDGANLVPQASGQTERYDYSDTTTIYVGAAAPGSLASAAVWLVQKFDLTDPSAATGTLARNIAWNDRATETYS